jgi:hypothetical protein
MDKINTGRLLMREINTGRPDDDEVLPFLEWCKLNNISERTGRRILASPDRPVVTQLSPHRIGITRGNNRRWQQLRERA